jgi:hypothetical protein
VLKSTTQTALPDISFLVFPTTTSKRLLRQSNLSYLTEMLLTFLLRNRHTTTQWYFGDFANGQHQYVLFSLSFKLSAKPTAYVKVFSPLWPFMISGAVTMYLVAKVQESSVSGSCLHSNFASSDLFVLLLYIAPEWRNDPRNPYAAKLAQSALL